MFHWDEVFRDFQELAWQNNDVSTQVALPFSCYFELV